MQPTISLIMPVFNGERTLLRSLDSVARQTFPGFECILVDDGSTDGSAALLHEYADRDPRFRVISIPNGGVSHAKNMGLDEARGDFIAFLDCDDTLEPTALEILYHIISETQADIAIAHISFEDAQGRPTSQTPAFPENAENPWCMTPTQATQIIFHATPFAGHLHAKLLRTEKFRTLRYREDLFIYEDMLYLLEALAAADLVSYTPVIAHHYLVAGGGALSATFSPRKASSLLACAEIQALVKHRFPIAEPAANRFAVQNALWALEELAASPAAIRKEPWAKTARERACLEIRHASVPNDIPFIQKCFCGAIRLGWPIFFSLYRVPYRLLKRIY